ncbi:MAG: hypothetical protein QXP77_01905 [Candidatus Aenigmatarchaeota archaeon]
MGDENFRLTKGHLMAGLLGAIGGGLVIYGITKWLPEYQEKVAKKQGEIIAEEFSKKMGIKYEKGSEVYSIKSSLEAMSSKLEELEKILREYRGG